MWFLLRALIPYFSREVAADVLGREGILAYAL